MEIKGRQYKMIFDYHTHTTFSHGKGSIEDNVKAAVAAGLSGIAITDHGPGHLTYGVKRSDFPVMRAEVDRLRNMKNCSILILSSAVITMESLTVIV